MFCLRKIAVGVWNVKVVLIMSFVTGCADLPSQGQAQTVVTPETAGKTVAAAKPGKIVLLEDGIYRDLTQEVGPTWMKGNSQAIRHIPNPQAVPDLESAKKNASES